MIVFVIQREGISHFMIKDIEIQNIKGKCQNHFPGCLPRPGIVAIHFQNRFDCIIFHEPRFV
jgi:hypothetical protein